MALDHNIQSGDDFEKWCSGVRPTALEEIVAKIYQEQGFIARTTPATGDGGVDVILEKENGPSGVDALVQVKRYSGIYTTVDAAPLNKLKETAQTYDPDRLIIISTVQFGNPVEAETASTDDYRVELIRCHDLYNQVDAELLSTLTETYSSYPGLKKWWERSDFPDK